MNSLGNTVSRHSKRSSAGGCESQGNEDKGAYSSAGGRQAGRGKSPHKHKDKGDSGAEGALAAFKRTRKVFTSSELSVIAPADASTIILSSDPEVELTMEEGPTRKLNGAGLNREEGAGGVGDQGEEAGAGDADRRSQVQGSYGQRFLDKKVELREARAKKPFKGGRESQRRPKDEYELSSDQAERSDPEGESEGGKSDVEGDPEDPPGNARAQRRKRVGRAAGGKGGQHRRKGSFTADRIVTGGGTTAIKAGRGESTTRTAATRGESDGAELGNQNPVEGGNKEARVSASEQEQGGAADGKGEDGERERTGRKASDRRQETSAAANRPFVGLFDSPTSRPELKRQRREQQREQSALLRRQAGAEKEGKRAQQMSANVTLVRDRAEEELARVEAEQAAEAAVLQEVADEIRGRKPLDLGGGRLVVWARKTAAKAMAAVELTFECWSRSSGDQREAFVTAAVAWLEANKPLRNHLFGSQADDRPAEGGGGREGEQPSPGVALANVEGDCSGSGTPAGGASGNGSSTLSPEGRGGGGGAGAPARAGGGPPPRGAPQGKKEAFGHGGDSSAQIVASGPSQAGAK
jgi:hypothetical protein